MNNKKILISIVAYQSDITFLIKSLNKFSEIKNFKIIISVFDNGNDLFLKRFCESRGYKYTKSSCNLGFGSGHNKNIFNFGNVADYILILNPDVLMTDFDLIALFYKIDKNNSIGLISPRLLNIDQSEQEICRFLPSPLDLFKRRFLKFFDKSFSNAGRVQLIDGSPNPVPFIHGACYLVRSDLFFEIGGFDSRYFLYMEDVDLCRKIWESHYSVIYDDSVSATHAHGKGSYKSLFLLRLHIFSAISYFNKWGWFFDKNRKKINDIKLKNIF